MARSISDSVITSADLSVRTFPQIVLDRPVTEILALFVESLLNVLFRTKRNYAVRQRITPSIQRGTYSRCIAK
jgi:hypothetical protein